MRVSYNPLWKLLIDNDMSQAELRRKAGIAPNTMTKLRRNQEVAMCVLIKICSTLNVNIGDVMDLIPETEPKRLWGEKNESELYSFVEAPDRPWYQEKGYVCNGGDQPCFLHENG